MLEVEIAGELELPTWEELALWLTEADPLEDTPDTEVVGSELLDELLVEE